MYYRKPRDNACIKWTLESWNESKEQIGKTFHFADLNSSDIQLDEAHESFVAFDITDEDIISINEPLASVVLTDGNR